MNDWYIIFNGQQVGPLSADQLSSYGLNTDSMVWHEGMSDWMRAGSVPELAIYLNVGTQAPQTPYPNSYMPNEKSKVAAGVLAILLGGLGVQYFYLGKIGGGFITILLTIVTCGLWEILTFVQGILMLTMSDQDFYNKYVYTDKTLPLF